MCVSWGTQAAISTRYRNILHVQYGYRIAEKASKISNERWYRISWNKNRFKIYQRSKYCWRLLSKIQQISSNLINHETRIWYLKSRKEPLIVVEELISRISGALKVGHFFMRPLPRTYRDGCVFFARRASRVFFFLKKGHKQSRTAFITIGAR